MVEAPCQIVAELDGRVEWHWPGLVRWWWDTSTIRPAWVVEPCGEHWRVRMIGSWGIIIGVAFGCYATQALAMEAMYRMEQTRDGRKRRRRLA